jgi:hypothetical protein
LEGEDEVLKSVITCSRSSACGVLCCVVVPEQVDGEGTDGDTDEDIDEEIDQPRLLLVREGGGEETRRDIPPLVLVLLLMLLRGVCLSEGGVKPIPGGSSAGFVPPLLLCSS